MPTRINLLNKSLSHSQESMQLAISRLNRIKCLNDIHDNIGDHKHSTRTSRVWHVYQTLSPRAGDVIHLVLWIQGCGFSETNTCCWRFMQSTLPLRPCGLWFVSVVMACLHNYKYIYFVLCTDEVGTGHMTKYPRACCERATSIGK